jgi:Protein of unknown function (DUF1176)
MKRGAAIVAVLLVCGSAALAQGNSLPRAAIEDGFKKADCTVELEAAARDPQSFDLGAGKTLFLVNCWRAAYQSGSIALVADGASAPRLLTFQSWDGKRFTRLQSLSEADYDPGKKTLSSYHKGRGIGDCGSMGEWTWTGSEFKLAKYFFKEKCDGRPFDGGRRWQIFPRR